MPMGLGQLMRLVEGESRSVTAENVYGEKGKGAMAELSAEPQPEVVRIGQPWEGPNFSARELGRGWKVRPCIKIPAGKTVTVMDVDGPGVIQHIWITLDDKFFRDLILRVYWDESKTPSVEVPVGDFFCNGWRRRANIVALPVNVNPKGGLNCYFPMPFRRHARITVENRNPQDDLKQFFYAFNYSLAPVAPEDAYFHAQFRRENPLPYAAEYTILDGVKGRGHYVGTYMAWQQNNIGWWGEGEFKAWIDGDGEFPTLCGTGTEDYFGGAWCFRGSYTAPFLGYQDVTEHMDDKPPGCGRHGNRHSLYRFHIPDPIRFRQDLKVKMQALGWRSDGRYLALRDDIASVAYWYQTLPHAPFPELGDRNALEVV